jgi:hypothetical protein
VSSAPAGSLPVCYEHDSPITHPPVLCRTEGVWHPQVCPPRPEREKVTAVRGTHGGIVGEKPRKHLSDEARLTRAAKNARNASRKGSGQGTRPKGTQRSGR